MGSLSKLFPTRSRVYRKCRVWSEAMVGFWQQIGLDPKITASDYNAYGTKRHGLKDGRRNITHPYTASG